MGPLPKVPRFFYSPELTEKMAHVLGKLGTKEAFVVFGEGTFDEISICGATTISHLKKQAVEGLQMTPEQYRSLLNASAASVAAGLDSDFKEGIERAKQSIDSGRAIQKLISLVNFTQECGVFARENHISP